jgi:hypothetical protein
MHVIGEGEYVNKKNGREEWSDDKYQFKMMVDESRSVRKR